ncbi:phosphoribosylglycinamide synthetase, ATP-grasp domain protein, partial [Chlamydia psittaci 84-8471/1]
FNVSMIMTLLYWKLIL